MNLLPENLYADSNISSIQILGNIATGYLSTETFLHVPVDVNAQSYSVWIFGRIESDGVKCEVGETPIELLPKVRTESLLEVSFKPQQEEVKCSLQYAKNPHLIQIQMTTKPGAYFNSQAWILDTTPEEMGTQMPIVIYAKINYGAYPLMKAEVKARITSPKGTVTEIQLFDDGRGEPDITKYDGVYSRYFIQFDSEGDYQILVTASDNQMQAKIGKNGATSCCGSTVFSEEHEVSSFQWSYHTVFRAKYKKPEKGYSPSRVLDLRVDSLDLPNSLVLKWTAPGGEMTEGKAHSYTLNMFKSLKDLSNQKSGEIQTATPKKFGEEETLKINLNEFEANTTYYIGLSSTSDTGQVGEMSNLVSVLWQKDQITTDKITPEDQISKAGGIDTGTIGLIVGLVILVLIIVIIIYIVVYFVIIRPKRRKEDKTESRSNHVTISPRTSPFGVNSIPADVILKHHNEVVSAKNSHKDPPIFKEENIENLQSHVSKTEDIPLNNNASIYALPDKRDSPYPQGARTPKRMTVV